MSYPLRSKRGPNLGFQERFVSLLAGAGLLWFARRKAMAVRAPLIVGSSLLFLRSFSGRDPIYRSLGISHDEDSATTVVRVQRSITVNRPRVEVFAFWSDLENLPRFMRHLESVEYIGSDANFSHWVARAPLGTTVEWDAQIIEKRDNELLAWHSIPGSKVENSGKVTFRDDLGGGGTEVKVDLKYQSRLGPVGAIFSRLTGEEPDQQIREDLRRFKRMVETGEVISVEGQTSARIKEVQKQRNAAGDRNGPSNGTGNFLKGLEE